MKGAMKYRKHNPIVILLLMLAAALFVLIKPKAVYAAPLEWYENTMFGDSLVDKYHADSRVDNTGMNPGEVRSVSFEYDIDLTGAYRIVCTARYGPDQCCAANQQNEYPLEYSMSVNGIKSNLTILEVDPLTVIGNQKLRVDLTLHAADVCPACGSIGYYSGMINQITVFRNLPLVTTQPVDAVAQIGSSTVMSMGAIEAVSYRWQKKVGYDSYLDLSDGKASDGISYSGTGTPSLTISGPTMANNGAQYRCMTYSSYGTPSYTRDTLLTVCDTNGPSLTLSYSPMNQTSGPITISAVASDPAGLADKPYSIDGVNYSTQSTFSVSKNGTYSVYAKDNLGNVTKETITISNIYVPTPTPTPKPTLTPTPKPTPTPTKTPRPTTAIVTPIPTLPSGGGGSGSKPAQPKSEAGTKSETGSSNLTPTSSDSKGPSPKSSESVLFNDSSNSGAGDTAGDNDFFGAAGSGNNAKSGGNNTSRTVKGKGPGRSSTGSALAPLGIDGKRTIEKNGIIYVLDDSDMEPKTADGAFEEAQCIVEEQHDISKEYDNNDLVASDEGMLSRSPVRVFLSGPLGIAVVIPAALLLIGLLLFILFFGVVMECECEEKDEIFDLCAVKLLKRRDGVWCIDVGEVFEENAVIRLRFGILFVAIFGGWEFDAYTQGNIDGIVSDEVCQKLLLYRRKVRRLTRESQ